MKTKGFNMRRDDFVGRWILEDDSGGFADFRGWSEDGVSTIEEDTARANMVAEAFQIYEKTGYTPGQMLDRLIEVLNVTQSAVANTQKLAEISLRLLEAAGKTGAL